MDLGPKMFDFLVQRMESVKDSPGPIDSHLIMRVYDRCLRDCFPGVPGSKLIKGFQQLQVSIS